MTAEPHLANAAALRCLPPQNRAETWGEKRPRKAGSAQSARCRRGSASVFGAVAKLEAVSRKNPRRHSRRDTHSQPEAGFGSRAKLRPSSKRISRLRSPAFRPGQKAGTTCTALKSAMTRSVPNSWPRLPHLAPAPRLERNGCASGGEMAMDYEPRDHTPMAMQVLAAWVVCLGIVGLTVGLTGVRTTSPPRPRWPSRRILRR
jgi:hypothetical protein